MTGRLEKIGRTRILPGESAAEAAREEEELAWPRTAKLAIDTTFVVAFLLTVLGIAAVFSFHVCFAALTLTAFAHSGRSFLLRAIPGLTLTTLAVARAVDRGVLSVEELYEIPILVLMMGFAAWSVQLHRRLLRRVRRQSAHLRQINAAGQMELRDQLLLAQRLETVGQLSAGVAHNLRNALATVLSLAERLEDETQDEQVRRTAHRIQSQTTRAGVLITDMLHHARPHQDADNADLLAAVANERQSLDILVGPDTELSYDLAEDTLLVQTSQRLVEQCLVNLVLNARDAVSGQQEHRGRIRVTAHRGTMRGREADDVVTEGAVLSVADNGPGIPAEIRQQAFEPFFTTKSDEGGAGLGLYSTLIIAEDAGGTVHIADDDEGGTKVVLTLPLATDDRSIPVRSHHDLRPEDLFGTEAVLVVDDDDVIRDRMCTTLTLYGYEATGARSGLDALQQTGDQEYALVVSDVIMPGMTGPEFISRARSKGLQSAVLFTSAHDKADGLIPESDDLLVKPFSRTSFLASVRRSIDAERRVGV